MEGSGTTLFTDEELLDALTVTLLPLAATDMHQELAGAFANNGWTDLHGSPDSSDSNSNSNSDSVVSVTLDADSHAFVRGSVRPGKRITPKQEIEELRAVAATLEKKARELKRRRKNSSVTKDTPFWERVAHRIAHEKGEAQQENIRLRALVDKHKSTIEGIASSITDVARHSNAARIDRPLRRWECHRPHGVDRVYEPVFANVAAAYTELDSIIHGSRLDPPVSWKGSRQMQIDMQQKEGTQSIGIRLEEARLAPFPWTVTTAHMWDFLCRFNEEKIRHGKYRQFNSDRTCIYGECPLNRCVNLANRNGHLVVQKFMQRDRMVIIWVIMVAGEGAPIQEKGWSVYEPGPDDPMHSTLCRTWVHFAPHTVSPQQQRSQGSAIGSTTDTVVEVYDETVGSLHDVVLSSLMQNYSNENVKVLFFNVGVRESLWPLSMEAANAVTTLFSDEELLDALLHVDPEPFPQTNGPTADGMTSDEIADTISAFSGFEGDALSLAELLFADEDQQAPSLKRARVTRSRQLSDMRVMANALEYKLEDLKSRLYVDQPEASRFWERIAQRMLVEKRLVIRENARLQGLLRHQIDAVRVLHAAFAKTPELTQQDITPTRYNPTIPPPKMPKKIYETLLANVDASYSNIDSLFSREARLLKPMDGKRKLNMEMCSENGLDLICVKMEESKAVPFVFAHVADQLWTYLSRVNEDEREIGFHRVFQRRGEHLFGECELKCSSATLLQNGYVVMRRFVEEKRVTLVWECVGTCETGSDNTISLPMQEKGWVFIDPSPEDAKTSVFRSCVHFTPEVLQSSSQALKARAKDIRYATELVLGVYENTVGHICEAVVSSMLNDTSLR